jgi:hypothetical protein
MLRELGYALGCTLEEPGTNIRNFRSLFSPFFSIRNLMLAIHRAFVTQEGQISATQLQGLRPCLPAHEPSWHRLDCLQFRYNPLFRLPVELANPPDEVIYWPCENGIIITSPSGIIAITIRLTAKKFPVAWFEYPDRSESEVFLFESDILERIPADLRTPDQEILLEGISAGGGKVLIDWGLAMKEGKTHIPHHSSEVFRSRMVGRGKTAGSKNLGYFIFNSQLMTSPLTNLSTLPSLLLLVPFFLPLFFLFPLFFFFFLFLFLHTDSLEGVSHARALYSIEFQYADGTVMLFGTPHPSATSTDFPLDVDSGEILVGFRVRADEWVYAIKVLTNKKESPWMGNTECRRVFWLRPPQGYEAIGICGNVGVCCDALGVVYTSSS